MSVPGTWSVEITDRYNNVVYSDSGGGPGTAAATWDGKQNGSYVDGIYTITVAALDSAGAQLASKEWWATISPADAEALVCGFIRDEPDWNQRYTVKEMFDVYDGCQARGLPCTYILDPLWMDRYTYNLGQVVQEPTYPYASDPGMNDLQRLTIGGWLVKPYRYFFYATHGTWDATNERAWIRFVRNDGDSRPIGGSSKYTVESARWSDHALCDVGVSPGQYRIAQIDACFSGGNFWEGATYETDIPNALGISGDVDSGQTYIGWLWDFWPATASILGVDVPIFNHVLPCGELWTQNFWRYLSIGFSVTQAEYETVNDSDSTYSGWMDTYLSNYGGPDATWLYR